MNEKEIVRLLVKDAVDKAINHYGFDGAREAIERVYSQSSRVRQTMIQELNSRIMFNAN